MTACDRAMESTGAAVAFCYRGALACALASSKLVDDHQFVYSVVSKWKTDSSPLGQDRILGVPADVKEVDSRPRMSPEERPPLLHHGERPVSEV
jgi:hypothetical protein